MDLASKIRVLRKERGLTQMEFSSMIGIDNSQFSKIERGKLEPTLAHLVEISSKFEVSLDSLVLDKKPETAINNIVVKENRKSTDQMPAVVTVDSKQRDNILLVPVKAAAGYLSGYGDPEFIKTLPAYRLPNLSNGTFRMFQVAGHSMYPTLHDGAFVVGEWVENWTRDIKDDRVYIVVSQNDGVVIKRVLNRLKKYNNLFCKSDNRKEYPSFNVLSSDIIEVWEVKLSMVFQLPNPADIYDKVNDLEAELLQLKYLLGKKD